MKSKQIGHIEKCFKSFEDAEKAANELQSGDSEWRYSAVDIGGYRNFRVGIWDEENKLVSYLTDWNE